VLAVDESAVDIEDDQLEHDCGASQAQGRRVGAGCEAGRRS
jgi:hypothetical protein